jgi:hypothetical protein
MNETTGVGLERSSNHLYRWSGGSWLPGVTSVIKKVDKSEVLIRWAKGVTADAALADLPLLSTMVADKGPAVAKAYLTAHATGLNDAAKNLGTQVHAAAEAMARGQDPGLMPEHVLYVDAYRRFLDERQPKFKSLEHYVANLTEGYGGTFDFIAVIDGEMTLCDVKTGKAHYVETRLQLSALGHAEFLGIPGDATRYALPHFDQYAVLHVRPEAYERGYQLYRVDINGSDWDAFRGALAIYRWDRQRPSKGEPWRSPVQEEVLPLTA